MAALLLALALGLQARPCEVPEGRGSEAAEEEPADEAGLPGTSELSPERVAEAALAESGIALDVGDYVAIAQSEVEVAVEDAARDVLEGYRVQGGCVLVESGYLDLFGSAWASVVAGNGWVEVVVVRERDEGGSDVRVMRMEANAWEVGDGQGP